MLNTITHLSNILGLELSPPPNIYNYSTKIYIDDILDNYIQYKIMKIDNAFFYSYTESKYIEKTKYYELKNVKDVHDIFINFVRDSYYDSPILFCNLERVVDNNFEEHYEKHRGYFYMGTYKNRNSDDLKLIYVRKNKKEVCYEYIVE